MHRNYFGLERSPVGESILLSQGYGLDLNDLRRPRGLLVKASGSDVRLARWDERTRPDLGHPRPDGGLPLIDMLHRLVWLWASGDTGKLRAYVEGTPAGEDTLVERLRRIIEDEQALATHEIRLVFGEVDGTVDGTELADAAREALTNVRKHARASQVVVSCHVTAGAGTVVVTDDGIGFDPVRTARGTGLRESIVGRMERAGGSADQSAARAMLVTTDGCARGCAGQGAQECTLRGFLLQHRALGLAAEQCDNG